MKYMIATVLLSLHALGPGIISWCSRECKGSLAVTGSFSLAVVVYLILTMVIIYAAGQTFGRNVESNGGG